MLIIDAQFDRADLLYWEAEALAQRLFSLWWAAQRRSERETRLRRLLHHADARTLRRGEHLAGR